MKSRILIFPKISLLALIPLMLGTLLTQIDGPHRYYKTGKDIMTIGGVFGIITVLGLGYAIGNIILAVRRRASLRTRLKKTVKNIVTEEKERLSK